MYATVRILYLKINYMWEITANTLLCALLIDLTKKSLFATYRTSCKNKW